ncbi:MAG TPA: CsbD family protein [Usitatibacter sp.]
MNKDQVKGRAKEVAGKIEKNVGRAVGSTKTEAKGLVKEVAGKIQKAVGDARNREFDKP